MGLLAAMYMDNIQIKILNKEKDINFGAIYENVAAQELKAHGFDLFYFNNKKQGELDFIVEKGGEVLPIEIKSGKAYTKHAALNHILDNEKYKIPVAYVFHNGNVCRNEKVVYYPVYMLMFLHKERELTNPIYKLDLSVLM